MPRIAIGLEYDGTDFVGWQIQREGRSVEGVLAAAVGAVADEQLVVHGAGRTDAGVHANQQVAHFDTTARRTDRAMAARRSTRTCRQTSRSAGFMKCRGTSMRAARRSRRRYRYSILQQATRPALARSRVWWIREPLDCGGNDRRVAALARRARFLRVSRRRLSGEVAGAAADGRADRAERAERTACSFAIEFTANAFLQHMVRNLVGTLVEIGRGDLAPTAALEMLASRDRSAGRCRRAARRTHARRRVVSGALRLADRRGGSMMPTSGFRLSFARSIGGARL